MELRHLRNFIAVAEELNFGRAARRLAMTQPPLSASIRQLEDDLGLKLFTRDSKRVSLTPEGKIFLAQARLVLGQVERATLLAAALAQGHVGQLVLGYSGTSMLYRGLPEIVNRFLKSNPGVDVRLQEAVSAEQVEWLRHQQIDAAFVATMDIPDGLQGHRILEERFVCCLPSAHALAARGRIELRQLSDEPFVMFRREASPSSHDNVLATCHSVGFSPKIRYAASQWINMVALVANGLGVAIVPASLSRCGLGGVTYLEIDAVSARTYATFLWNPLHVAQPLHALVAIVQRGQP